MNGWCVPHQADRGKLNLGARRKPAAWVEPAIRLVLRNASVHNQNLGTLLGYRVLGDAVKGLCACVFLSLITGVVMAGVALGDDTLPPLEVIATIRLVRPAEQVDQINRWFSGSKGRAPAGVLAAWKRATAGRVGLGKPLEALIASFNSEMVAEWKVLDDSVLTLWRSGASADRDDLDWSVVIPRDDGSIAAFLVATRITEGDSEPKLDDRLFQQPVERLGPSGAPVSLRVGKTVVVAGSRRSLSKAVTSLKQPTGKDPRTTLSTTDSRSSISPEPSGVRFEADACTVRALAREGLGFALGKELVKELEGVKIEGMFAVEPNSAGIHYRTTGRWSTANPRIIPLPIESAWLDWIPRSGTVAAMVLRIDPSPSTWNTVFSFVDRVEKSDPAKSRMMPVRTRLNSLLAIARAQPEVDFWPRLRGLTVSVVGDDRGNPNSLALLLAIHTQNETSAANICETMVPRITATYLEKPKTSSNKQSTRADEVLDGRPVFRLENVRGKPLLVTRRGSTVLLGWGESAESRLSRLLKGDEAVDRSVIASAGRKDVSRLILFWPMRYSWRLGNTEPGAAAQRVLEEAPPIIWYGGMNAEKTQIDDLIVWNGIQPLVQRFLNAVPMSEPLPR